MEHKKPEPINNTKLVEEFRQGGGQIMHIHGKDTKSDKSRGMTIAFVPRGGRVEVATSVTHRNDCFTKKIGTKLAIEHFHAGKTIFLPLRKNRNVMYELSLMFEEVTW